MTSFDEDAAVAADAFATEVAASLAALPPPTRLLAVQRLRAHLPEVQWRTARELHDEHGFGWGELGRALGVSRQAARERFGVRPPATR